MPQLKQTILIILVIVGLIFLLKIGFFYIITNFFQHIFYTFGLTMNVSRPTAIKNLETQVLQLQAENAELKIQLGDKKTLDNQIKFLKTRNYNFTLANIIGQKNEAGFNWYLLDRGNLDGLKNDLAVIINDGYLLGKIIKTEPKQAYFLPIFDDHFFTSVDFIPKESSQSLNIKQVTGLLNGRHGLTMEVNFIPIDKNINIGDKVVTSGLELSAPRGLIVGEVQSIEKKNNAPFQTAIIKPMVSLNEVRIVTVVLSKI